MFLSCYNGAYWSSQQIVMAYSHRRLIRPLNWSFGASSQTCGSVTRIKTLSSLSEYIHWKRWYSQSNSQVFFNSPLNHHIFVLYGLVGAGKAQIALKFVEMCQGKNVPKWVQLNSYLGFWLIILPCFLNVYFIDTSMTENHSRRPWKYRSCQRDRWILGEHLHWLAMQHEEWLLLLNNADHTTFNICKYFPRCSHSSILITTQNHEIAQDTLDKQSYCHVSDIHPTNAKNSLFNISRNTPPRATSDNGIESKYILTPTFSTDDIRFTMKLLRFFSHYWLSCLKVMCNS